MDNVVQIKNERNNTIDVIRGLAMLLVVLGHTMTGCVEGATDSFLFQIVWSLQMPLFMLISGYVTKFSKPIIKSRDLFKQIGKKTIAYLLPWVVWTFIVRGVIFGQTSFFNLGWLVYHMDSGYWFLFSLWTIVIIFSVSSYIANKSKHNLFIISIMYIFGLLFLLLVGLYMGMSFLGIKLTAYYMPFFFIGYVFSIIEDKYKQQKTYDIAIQSVVSACLLIWLFIIARVNVYDLNESVTEIVLRAFTSLTGCIAVSGLLASINGKYKGGVAWIGMHTLEVYTLHYLLLNLIQMEKKPYINTIHGTLLILTNYVITITLVVVFAKILCNNKLLRRVLFGKK